MNYFSEMEWNTRWEWENFDMFGSKASDSPKKVPSADWMSMDDGEISFNLSGGGGNSGGSGLEVGHGSSAKSSISASTDSLPREGMKTPNFNFEAFEGSAGDFTKKIKSTIRCRWAFTQCLFLLGRSVIKRLARNGRCGYADGDLGSAMFNRPKSFAVDYRGNVYVADQTNFAIRKITKSGVTTIAGGYSEKTVHVDGPALNASFSVDFELVLFRKKCALMVSDRGYRLIRQINLKAEDCTAHSGSSLGVSPVWFLGVGLSCLFGPIVGFIIRPHVIPHGGSKPQHCSGTWNQCLMSLERQIVILCSDIRSVIVSSTAYSLCTRLPGLSLSSLSLIFRLRTVESRTSWEKPVSLMDYDVLNSPQLDKAQTVADQLTDLISFDGSLSLSENANEIIEHEAKRENATISSGKNRKIDGMIRANIESFVEKSVGVSLEESLECSLGLAKRRLNAGNSFF